MKKLDLIIIASMIFLMGCNVNANEDYVSSGDTKNAIIELYTSEGCSSCPPAEAWLSKTGELEEYSETELIPLAFYVDYWDYLGWKDPYAHPDYSMRQKMHQINGAIRTLYTPQLILDARELRPVKTLSERFAQVRSSKASLQLDLRVDKQQDHLKLNIKSLPLKTIVSNGQSLFFALTENNIVSRIRAGENSGRTLTHDYVVREFIGPLEIDASKDNNVDQLIKINPKWNLDEIAVVAFVQTMNGEILQAVRWSNK